MDTPRHAPGGARLRWLPAIFVAGAAALPFLFALDTPLLGDDRMAVLENPDVQGDVDLPRIFTTNSWGSVEYYRHTPNYRPLSVLTLAATRAVAGTAPMPYKATNLALHVVASLLLLGLIGRLGGSPAAATLAAIAFAVHPVHVEVLLFAVNREEILVSILLLVLLRLAVDRSGLAPGETRRRWTAGSLALLAAGFATALLSKESGATGLLLVPLVLLAWPAGGSRLRAIAAPSAVLLAVFAGYLALRLAALGHLVSTFIPFQDNPLVLAGPGGRVTGALALVAEAGALLAVPLRLSIDYSWNVLGLPLDGFPARSWAGLAMALAAVAAFAGTVRRRPGVALGLGVLAVTYGFVSNVAFLNSIVFGERLLYAPSLGLALALGCAPFARPSPSGPGAPGARIVRLALAILLVAWIGFLGVRSVLRAQDYRSQPELLASSLAQRPGSSRLQVNLGVERMREGRRVEAENRFRQALAIDPDDAEAHQDLALLMAERGRPAEAASLFLRAIELRPGFPEALAGLCLLLESRGEDEAALEWCAKAARRGAPIGDALSRLESDGRCRAPGTGPAPIVPADPGPGRANIGGTDASIAP